MTIPTSRTKESAKISIDVSRCKGSGLCIEVCKCFNLILENGKVISQDSVYVCIGCGHCMAICSHEAIKISGRCLTPDDLLTLPEQEDGSYKELLNLLLHRRSIREFKDVLVEKEIIEKVIEAAKTSPIRKSCSKV